LLQQWSRRRLGSSSREQWQAILLHGRSNNATNRDRFIRRHAVVSPSQSSTWNPHPKEEEEEEEDDEEDDEEEEDEENDEENEKSSEAEEDTAA
jgi:hypothetical protein